MKVKTQQTATLDGALKIGVTAEQFAQLTSTLGREPLLHEVALFERINGRVVASETTAKHVEFSMDDIEEPESLKASADLVLQQANSVSSRWLTQYAVKNNKNKSTVVEWNGTQYVASPLVWNANYLAVSPEKGAEIALQNALLDVVCLGAEPRAVVNTVSLTPVKTINGSNESAAIVKGLSNSIVDLDVEIAAADNEFVVLGALTEVEEQLSIDFKCKGDLIFLFGASVDDVSGSEYIRVVHGVKNSPAPQSIVENERALQKAIIELTDNKLINAAHAVSSGGVYTTLVEMSMPGDFGFDIEADGEVRLDSFLFSESHGRTIVTVSEDKEDQFIEYLAAIEVPTTLLGHVTKGKLVVDGQHFGFITDARNHFDIAVEARLK